MIKKLQTKDPPLLSSSMLLVPIQPSLLLNKQLMLTKLLKLKELKLSKSSNQDTMISSRKEDRSLLLQWLLVVSSFLLYPYLSQAEYHASVQNQTEKRTRRKSRQMFYQLKFNVNW